MAAITFDTLKFVHRLREAGIAEPQAEAIAEAFKDASGEAEIATKRDIERLETAVNSRFDRMDGEMKLNRWMMGIVLAGILSLVLKAFFPH
ncbi:MAG: CCDC90 family protein [Alphaproteobacteria bacterium]